jgi:2-amino-4-hydroxy-6-hydroxymethyldihydropteridine diphosphokinase
MSFPIALSLGSNSGDKNNNLRLAIDQISQAGITIQRLSAPYPSDPVDCPPDTPRFLNLALTASTALSPRELLDNCQKIEVNMGRPRNHGYHESRVIDIDILLYDQQIIDIPGLRIPHPRLLSRRFMLEPLAQIASDWIIPGENKTVIVCYTSIHPLICKMLNRDALK